ncbi:unnamed protein product [Vitrella brassicaformis CCMP3155]|uniref:Uncharacterized protein n=1 Tax=Vitrella brassicaformis (strain CCMP3155) TaxID=1169540 RepID=A0A0G4G4U5_VITBC|nr:unnamed protein product [Vitrella brassicaformis CCMP3155]|eukprot:CEM23417.1 unnamed protein product [Vitrella brassicaformis CCMP3155]
MAGTTGTSFRRPTNVKCQVADGGLMDMDNADGPAAAAAAGVQGGAANGTVSLRDVIDQLDSMTSQMVACTEAAKLRASHLDDNTEDRGRLADALKTFTDAHSTLRNELTHILTERLTLPAPRYKETNGGTVVFMREVEGREEELKPVTVPHRTKPPPHHNQDLRMGGKTFSWKGKSSAGTTTKTQESTPVVAAGGEGEGKRRRVAFEPAAAAAAASSPSQAGRRLPREGLILISGYGVWPLFNNSIAKEAGAQCRQLDIDCSRAADRAFWQAMPVNVAKRWGGRMPKLMRIWCCHPAGEGAWCLDVITALIEGHTEGRTAMVAEKRTEAEKRGEAADIPDGSLTTIAFEAAELSDEDMPSAHEHVDTLGPLVGSSRCLRVFDVPSTVEQKRAVLERVPVAAEEGQPRPLANLEDIGPIVSPDNLMTNLEALTVWRTRLQMLRSVLVSRGCRRSLKSLKVKFIDRAVVGHEVFELAVAIRTFACGRTFASAVCIGDVPISFTGAAPRFPLSHLYNPLSPAAPSPVLKTLMRQLADQATQVTVDLRWSDLAIPPTAPVLNMARGLAFNKATEVFVFGVDQPAQPVPTHPALAIIEQIQPMPQASSLVLHTHTALAAGTQLASKMPNLRVLSVQGSVPMEQALQAIKAVGCERELDMAAVSDTRGVGSGGIDIGEHREGFPHISKVVVELTVPGGVTHFVEFACSSVRSLLQLNCKTVVLRLLGLDSGTRSLLESAVPAQLGSIEGTTILQERDTWSPSDGDSLRIAAKHDSG